VRSPVDGIGRLRMPNVLGAALTISALAVAAMEARGMLRGGDFRQSLWQFRQILWLPVLTGIFSYSLRGPRDLAPLVYVLTGAACLKIGFGLWYMTRIAWPNGFPVEFMTCHEDSVTFATTIVLWLAMWAHGISWRGKVMALMVSVWVLIGIAANARRIAYVSLGANLVLLFFMLSKQRQRQLLRVFLMCLPLLIPYLVAGRNRNTGIFKPASMIMSVWQQKDGSSQTRDIENFNLLSTLRPHMLIGSGFGHEYNEVIQADDISRVFAQYRFIAHNSVLWLLTIGGAVGFTLLWLPLIVGLFLARRSYAHAHTTFERVAAATAAGAILCYIVQAWGDMGTQGWTCMVMVSWALAAAGKLAVGTGAFPAHVALLRSARPVTGLPGRGPLEATTP
jgi:hypothetical protein